MKGTLGYLLPLLLFLTYSGCSKDDTNFNNELTGVWFKEVDHADNDQKSITEWSFADNGSFEILSAEVQKSTGNFLGLSTLQKGDYVYQRRVLYMKNMLGYSYAFDGEAYIVDAEYMLDRESLLSRNGTGFSDYSASISFGKGKGKIVLTYLECNDVLISRNCIGEETLNRR